MENTKDLDKLYKLSQSNRNRTFTPFDGLVTSGTNWIFMKLENDMIYVDSVQYYENQLNKIIAILKHIVEECIPN